MMLSYARMLSHMKPRVLCIDDEPKIGLFIQEALEQTGCFFVESETNALDAVVTARRFRPDVLVIDIKMPGLDGFTVARRIREEPWLRYRPILFFSGFEYEVPLHAADEAPMEFLKKGVPLLTIVQTIARLAGERLDLYTPFERPERILADGQVEAGEPT
ncbi:MAG: sensor protein [Chthoniobacter sp.]|nr:sensor protein [Chthoniobacter sp.]